MSRVAFLFPGQGSQVVGMGKKLAEKYPVARKLFDEADQTLGFPLSRLCWDGPLDDLTLTQHAQPAILTCSVAMARVLMDESGVTPSVVAGHSLGEYSALVVAGALSFSDAVKAVHLRGKWMQEAVPSGQGGMLALIGLEEEDAEKFCDEVFEQSNLSGIFSVANLNGGGQIVVAGHQRICQWAAEHVAGLTVKPRRVVPLNVSAPFHCELMKPAEEKLGQHLRTLKISPLKTKYIANVDAKLHSDHQGVIDRLIGQVCSPVRWEASMRLLAASGEADEYWEVGPGNVLTGLMKRIAREAVVQTKGQELELAP